MPFLDDGHKKALFAQVLAVHPTVKTEGCSRRRATGVTQKLLCMSEPTDVASIKDLAATPGDRAVNFHWLAEESDVKLRTHLWQPRQLAQELDVGPDALAVKGFVSSAKRA